MGVGYLKIVRGVENQHSYIKRAAEPVSTAASATATKGARQMMPVESIHITVKFTNGSEHTYELSEVQKWHWSLETVEVEPKPGDEWRHHEPTGFINLGIRAKLEALTNRS